MAEVASAWVSLLPSAKGFGSKLQSEVGGEVNTAGKKLGSGFGKMFALGGGLIAAAGIGSILSDSIGEAREAQKVGALTESIIKSTGGAAKVTAAQVGDLAGAISLKTGMDDEAIQSGANLLLTFKQVRNEVGKGNDVFDRATQAATDLSAAGFGDLNGQAKMLGKALNDPIKGISALSRSGVTFTAQQQEQIKAMVASGKTLQAQKIILGEVESQVGGAAEASATAGEKASVAFGNLKEDLGTAVLPAVDALSNAFVKMAPAISSGIGAIGPALSSAKTFLAPFAAQIAGLFGGGGAGSGISAFAASIQTNVLPVLRTFGETFATVILPAVTRVAAYVGSSLMPVFSQVAGIISSKVLPILSSFAQFFYGKVIPAVVAVVQTVGSKLKPIFDQLVSTFKANVLPAIENLLGKFREWQPTIQKVVTVVIKIQGKILEFAAAVLGKVLPPLVRFAGFLLGTTITAVTAVIGIIVKIIAKAIEFGAAIVERVQDVARFVTGLREKFGEAIDFVKGIPGKALSALGDLGSTLKSAGERLIQGLIDGISSKIGAVRDKMSEVMSAIRGYLPGSPIKWGPLKDWNGGGAGKRLMGLIETGIAKATPRTVKAAETAFGRISDSLERTRDRLRSKLDGLKGDFASLAESVSGAFAGNLFDVSAITADAEAGIAGKTAGQAFIDNLMGKKAELSGLLASFKTLKGWGLDPGFLSQLFASGNGALITDLAGMGQTGALEAGALFSDVTGLGDQLGNAVAKNDPISDRIDVTNSKLDEVVAELRYLGTSIGKELNGAASKAQRDKKKNRGRK